MLSLPAPSAPPLLPALPAPPTWDWSWAFPPPPPPPRRVPILMFRFDVHDGLGLWTEKALAVLAEYNRPPRLFQRGGTLVRAQDSLLTGRARLVVLDDIMLNHHISECTTCVRVMLNRQGEETVDAVETPLSVSRNILASPAWDPEVLPPVRDLAECPRFAGDGRLLESPGYYRSEELYLCPPPGLALPPVPARPTEVETIRAKDLLLGDLLDDFNLDSASRAHALCALLEPLCRRLIGGPTPIYVIDAPVHGAGKTLLGATLQIPATGRAGEVTPPKQDDAEMRKSLTALMLNSPTYVMIDNVATALNFASLAALVTAPSGVWTDRLLGASRMVELPNVTTWIITSNNCSWSRELCRRAALVRLQPGCEEPWRRSGFKHEDLVGWAVTNRAELLHAALTLIQNWISAGSPPGPGRMGSFESWARVMGGILDTAGIEGFLGNREALFARDPDALRWRALAREWYRQHSARLVSIADLYALINMNAELDTAFADVLGQGQERKQRQQLAKALATQDGRVWSGYAIEAQHHAGANGGFPLYRLLPTRAAEAEAEATAAAEAEAEAEAGRGSSWEPDTYDSTPNPWDQNPWDDPDA